MRTKDMFPSKYLKSDDAKAKQIITTISHMQMELVGQGQDQKKKPVLYLEDSKTDCVEPDQHRGTRRRIRRQRRLAG